MAMGYPNCHVHVDWNRVFLQVEIIYVNIGIGYETYYTNFGWKLPLVIHADFIPNNTNWPGNTEECQRGLTG